MKGIIINADKTRMLRLNINRMAEYKKTRGEDITASLSKLQDSVDFELIRYIFYLGLKHEDKDLTEEGAGDILDILIENQGLEYVVSVLVEAITAALGIKDDLIQDHKTKSKNQ